MNQITDPIRNGSEASRRRASVVDATSPETATAPAGPALDTTRLDLIGAVVAVGFFLLPLLAGAFRG